MINGKLQDDVINDSLDKYINKYVVCKNCGLPEYHMLYPEGKGLTNVCNSCGHREEMDPTNRVTK